MTNPIVKTEKQHAGEFLLSEAQGTLSREAGTLKNGETVTDGMVLMLSGGYLKAHDGDMSTDDVLSSAVEGIVIGDWDATGGAVKNVPYIARLAEVKDSAVVYPEEHTDTEGGLGQKVAVVKALKALNIRTR